MRVSTSTVLPPLTLVITNQTYRVTNCWKVVKKRKKKNRFIYKLQRGIRLRQRVGVNFVCIQNNSSIRYFSVSLRSDFSRTGEDKVLLCMRPKSLFLNAMISFEMLFDNWRQVLGVEKVVYILLYDHCLRRAWSERTLSYINDESIDIYTCVLLILTG